LGEVRISFKQLLEMWGNFEVGGYSPFGPESPDGLLVFVPEPPDGVLVFGSLDGWLGLVPEPPANDSAAGAA
jgi:hypothetical protein